MIKYLGSKRRLIPWIIDTIRSNCPDATSVLDLFSGTSRVGYALKERGFSVQANDHNAFAFHLAHCYLETSIDDIPNDFMSLIDHLNNLPGQAGFFTENYCRNARFFHPKNGEKIDAIRNEIEKLSLYDKLRSVLLVSLMEAADRVDSTCGIQMAYLKTWAKRADLPLKLRMPKLLAKKPGQICTAHCLDAVDAAQMLTCDVAYLDPPYNQHSYRGNYHIWETLVRNDQPAVYGKALKRTDCQTIKSDFNSKRKFRDTLTTVLTNLKSKYIIVSFNDEGFINKSELEILLSNFGTVEILDIDYKRYVGAQIGIYNQLGIKVGSVKKLQNKEFLYIVTRASVNYHYSLPQL
jgi:adenine-specific DNA-methyltransferase